MPTRRRAAARRRVAARAIRGSNLRNRVTDERLHVAAGDDHRVDAGPLELEHVRAARAGELGDRELAGRYVRQEVEQALEKFFSFVRVLGREQQDLRVDELE